MPCHKTLKDIEHAFCIPPEEIKRIMRAFHSEMKKGLSGRKSSLKMLHTYVKRPGGAERGDFLGLDLGGTNFRVLALRLKGNRKASVGPAKKFILQKRHIANTGRVLFDFIARCIKAFINEFEIDTAEKQNIGFTFSFPIKKRGIASGILFHWTKGFKARGVEGKDVVKLLNESLRRKGLRNVKVTAIANDTVSTFVAKSYEDPNCSVGVILGTGTNACYSEKKGMVINIEWGNFNKLHNTAYDRELDKHSKNPGEQLLEKMVSGMYLGEVTRLVVKDLIKEKRVFKACDLRIFNKSNDFKAEYMSTIESDSSRRLLKVNMLLKKLGIPDSEYGDRELLKKISAIVSTRAARLSAVAIASVVTKIDPYLSGKHTVAIDGSVYEKHPGFSRRMKATLKEIFSTSATNIRLCLTKDASAKGAAIIAATRGDDYR